MDRNSISETHATRIGNSFLKKENSFRQAMKQRVLLERIFNRKSYEQDRNFRNSCHKNPEFFFFENDDSFWQASSRRSFWKKCLIADLMKRELLLRIHQIKGRISYNQNFINLTSIAGNFDNYRPNYLMKSDKALLQYNGGVGT